MGLCNLPRVNDFIQKRKAIAELYLSELNSFPLSFPDIPGFVEYNYSYFPVIFRNEEVLLKVKNNLANENINTRRYFYPSLNKLPYLAPAFPCPVSEDIAQRVLCLPFYQELPDDSVIRICSIIKKSIKS
jgi:dTDP-4-amino-4,6-dideoxygalactose transaminase